MSSIRSETLDLIEATRFYLEELPQPAVLLASGADCDYFRKHYFAATLPKQDSSSPETPPKKSSAIPSAASPQTSCTQTVRQEPLVPLASNTEPHRSNAKESSKSVQSPENSSPAKGQPKPNRPEPSQNTPVIAVREPPQPAPQESFDDLRKIWNKITAGAPVFEEIPNDEIAKKIANRWKTKNAAAEISILAYQEPPSQRILLEQIAKAIHTILGPARIVQAEPIEKEKQWEAFLSVPHLKLTIACDYTLWQLRGLMHHYREAPSQGTRHLGAVPVFLLPDLSLYLKDPLLKRSLWKALCQTLS